MRRLEGVCIDDLVTTRPAALWTFDAPEQSWRLLHASEFAELSFLFDGSARLEAGSAIFARSDAPFALVTGAAPASVRIEYIHGDHLGSASVITDGEGRLVEERSFLPFGQPRHEHRAAAAEPLDAAAYLFTQKERDRESGLHYFETTRRALASASRSKARESRRGRRSVAATRMPTDASSSPTASSS